MNIILYFGTLITLAAIDSIWLFTMGGHYKKWLAALFAPNFSLTPAAIFYFIYAFGVLMFVILPGIKRAQAGGGGALSVLLYGMLLGFVAYGAYDLTNQATLRSWPTYVTIIDMAWGTVLTGLASLVVYSVYAYFH